MSAIRYANQRATRSLPLSPELEQALGFLPELGITAEVFSGGQAAKGSGGPRTGSVRHDHGNAADVRFYQGDRQLDWANPDDLPLFQEIVERGKANGLTGFGAGPGYMAPGTMHVGFGAPGVWGAGGRSANAPDWLRAAYGEAPAGNTMMAGSGGSDMAYGGAGSDRLGTNYGGLGGLGGMQEEPKPEGVQGFLMSPAMGSIFGALSKTLTSAPGDAPLMGFGENLAEQNALAMKREAFDQERLERTNDRKAIESVLLSRGFSPEQARALSVNPSAANLAIEQRKEDNLNARANITADRIEPTYPDIAEAIRSQAITGAEGLREYYARQKADRDAPSGYRRTASGELEFIPGGPADPAAAGRLKPNATFEAEQGLRKEYSGTAEAKEFADVRSSYDRLRASAATQSGVGDLGIIYGYMKMLDPGSVVREGEFATAEQASGVPERVLNIYNKLLTGERLSPDQRKTFVDAAGALYSKSEAKTQALNDRFTAIAGQYGIDPARIIQPLPVFEPMEYGQPETPPADPAAAAASGPASAPPPAPPATQRQRWDRGTARETPPNAPAAPKPGKYRWNPQKRAMEAM